MIEPDPAWPKLLMLAVAGASGTLARYGFSALIQRVVGSAYPWGTLAVNAVGCLLFGLVWASAEQRLPLSPQMRLIVLVGFLGAFTTFSTYAFEAGEFARTSQWLAAASHMILHNGMGLAMVLAGLALGRLL